ncbi:glycosyltransferase family 2 protein [Campylobacter volucris]|uniref:Glycosyltransferase family 2 protein n=1 Tax=Campylobacter volucris TaxID=1031542 RepID=A0A5C7E2S8_9BACT|nr:glycosyltransferase family A protein [Campylobacter volucris]TXE88611.1 glycosyltransferase family 2 protein [Campylobacter volucris]
MNNPLITIIIPIYNVASYLEECLDSVINQTYKNLDIILVDDGSTDESLNIALKYLNKDERIFLISKENGGQSSARNTGLEFIKGTKLRTFFENNNEEDITSFTSTHTFEKNTKILKKEDIKSNFMQIQKRYIKTNLENINDFIIQELPNTIIHFLDSDDYLLQDCIELCVKEMIEKDLDICAHGLQEYKNKEFIKKDFFEKTFEGEFYNPLDLLKLNKKYNFYFAWQGVFKANILNQYNLRFTHGIYHEDHDFGTILFCLAKKMFYIKKSLIIYRIRQGSITNIKSGTMPQKLPKYLESLREYFNDYIELRKYFKLYCDLIIAKNIFLFNQNLNNHFLKKSIKRYYIRYFDLRINNDPLNLKKEINFFIKNLKQYNIYIKIRNYIRHPKKLLNLIIK